MKKARICWAFDGFLYQVINAYDFHASKVVKMLII